MSPPDNRDSSEAHADPHDRALRAAHDHGQPDPEDLGFALPEPSRTSRTGVIVVLAVLVAGAFALGWSQRSRARSGTDLAAPGEPRVTRVEVIKPQVVESDHAMSLPGTVRALEQTKIYPRVTGYVHKWHVDIGDKVTAGQLL
ncbi:MAG TPA: efflux RND transporter periplasmic adaptor subunit, partial [Kofleriaceae bacterium]|nr:efflux RND transporter periplasmic adaptor subunit [Kofleriaceae bacterium]